MPTKKANRKRKAPRKIKKAKQRVPKQRQSQRQTVNLHLAGASGGGSTPYFYESAHFRNDAVAVPKSYVDTQNYSSEIVPAQNRQETFFDTPSVTRPARQSLLNQSAHNSNRMFSDSNQYNQVPEALFAARDSEARPERRSKIPPGVRITHLSNKKPPAQPRVTQPTAKRGRPVGSKNKPKETLLVTEPGGRPDPQEALFLEPAIEREALFQTTAADTWDF